MNPVLKGMAPHFGPHAHSLSPKSIEQIVTLLKMEPGGPFRQDNVHVVVEETEPK